MSQLAQFSEGEIEQRFHITGRMAVLFSLGEYVHGREQFTVYFNEGRESFLTYLLAVRPETGELIVDVSGSPQVNAHFLESARNIFVARPEGVSVQFAAGKSWRVDFDGEVAFALPAPKFIIRLQRREYFRVTTPVAKPILVSVRVPDKGLDLTLPMHDLSVAGCGLCADNVTQLLDIGMAVPYCDFVLPGAHETAISTRAVLRHVTPVSRQPGQSQFRIGLQFDQLQHVMEHRIQRYIVQLEHERHELLK
jgi:c-di-GMP-binding flagellar brake protein YcgR